MMELNQKQLQTQYIGTKTFKITILNVKTVDNLIRDVDADILTKKFVQKHHRQLSVRVFLFKIQHQNREWIKKKLSEFQEFSQQIKKKYGKDAPILPAQKQNELSQLNVNYIQQSLLIFLKRILQLYENGDEDVTNFLDIMPQKYGTSYIINKGQELFMQRLGLKNILEVDIHKPHVLPSFEERFVAVVGLGEKDFSPLLTTSKSFDIKQMLPFSGQFKFYFGGYATEYQLGIVIQSTYRKLELRANSIFEFALFINSLSLALKKSPYCKEQRYESFSAVQDNCFSKFYIDGQNYFKDICQSLLKAEKYVYITDWMLTPYMLLKRPSEFDDRSSRLDYVLESIAQRGVKVQIILYMEPEIALNNDSNFVSNYLQQMNKNIKVLRHPNYILIPFLWSHHQKMVVIDQKCAFLGGLDLCYGRWDTQKHSLQDKDSLWKGADFCNFRISDIYKPRNFLISNIDSLINPRMPWHDIGIQIRGPSVIDVTRHFVQYWNFVSFQTRFNQRDLLLHSGHSHQPQRRTTLFTNLARRESLVSKTVNISVQQEEDQQKDYYDQFIQDNPLKFNIELPHLTINQIRKYPKKFYNYLKEGEDWGNLQRLLLPAEQKHSNETFKKSIWGQQLHQIIRSASTWSLGLQEDKYERSIYLAYQDCIRNSRDFIYIQNQFFICKKNIICQLIAERILRAYRNSEKFKVMIVIPLLPGFEGDIADDSSAVMRIQLNWEYVTILRSKFSLFSRISEIPNISDYVQVLSLRSHAKLGQKNPVTQILYIHSKLMIIDDCKVILGSANINDRSLLGDRDSQIGIVVEDKVLMQLKNNRLVSESIHNLRCELYKQHFCLSSEEAIDYHNQKVWKYIASQAQKNTKLYRQIFGCYPDDKMKAFKDIQKIKNAAQLERYDQLKHQIIGNVVQWPMLFLEHEDLTLRPSQKQFFVPDINFT